MRKIYRAHFLEIELFLSFIIIGVVAAYVFKCSGIDAMESGLDGIREGLYGTIAALAGALLGFVITGLSVLLTTSDTQQVKVLRQSKHYKTIFKIFFSTSKYLGLLLLLSLLSLIFDKKSSPEPILTLMTFWALTISSFRIIRCLWVLEKIINLHILKK